MKTQEEKQLSEHFSLSEFTRSATAQKYGIKNEPGNTEIKNLKILCHEVLEPLRQYMGKPIFINSGYRCLRLNKLLHGVEASQHLLGQAADIRLHSIAEGNLFFDFILIHCSFDQLLFEHSRFGGIWLHVSCKPEISKNRKMARRGVCK